MLNKPAPPTPPNGATQRTDPPQFRVLIVEDEDAIARLIAATLRPLNLDLRYAPDGKHALAAFEKTQPHLVLLDLMLPEIDGRQVCAQIRMKSHVPIIMMTAMDSEQDQLDGFKMGADDYIPKPFNPRLMVARVAAHLRRNYKYNASQTMQTVQSAAQPAETRQSIVERAAGEMGGVFVPEQRSAPAGWAQCDNCGYMGPRERFEKENALGRVHIECPSCKSVESVVFSLS